MITHSKRVTILGLSCSGKTRFSNDLSEILNIPVYHLDEFYWEYPWKKRETFDINALIVLDTWILDGNYWDLHLEERLDKSDIVFYLNTSLCRRLYRMLVRDFKFSRRLVQGNPVSHKINITFICKTIYKHIILQPRFLKKLIARYPNKILYFTSFSQMDEYLSRLINE